MRPVNLRIERLKEEIRSLSVKKDFSVTYDSAYTVLNCEITSLKGAYCFKF
jgi:hypothetical protein